MVRTRLRLSSDQNGAVSAVQVLHAGMACQADEALSTGGGPAADQVHVLLHETC